MNYNLQTHLEEYLTQAYGSLGFTSDMLRERYPDLQPHFSIRTPQRDTLYFTQTTPIGQSFLVNRKNICEAIFISLDIYRRTNLIRSFIRYCNERFPYNYLFKTWIYHEGTIELKVYGYSVIIVLTRTYTLPEFIRDL